jgi:formylglycine-generating enzyme required for sulfatase activity
MPDDREVFAALTALVLERRASPEELERFRELLREHPEFIEIYRRQIMLAALLPALSLWETTDTECSVAQTADAVSKPACENAAFWRRALATAAALLVLATGFWFAKPMLHATRHAHGGSQAAQQPALHLVRTSHDAQLDLPDVLPGTVRLESGMATVRLASGVDLSLIAPLEMEVCDAMQARLVSGSMLATISWKHGGFTLRTPDLEMWDNGAIYCASVTDRGSDIFVFKGEAQVVEACGEPVDICRAGEGVRARRDGSGTVKVKADWPEGEHMLAQVMAKGVSNEPEEALSAASHVSDGWAERWMPKVVERPKPVPGLRGGRQPAAASRQSGSRSMEPEFQQTPIDSGGTVLAANKGEKSSAPTTTAALPQKEEETMKATVNSAAAMAAAVTMSAGAAWAVPAVSNVNMQQIPYTRQVRITYDLSDENAIVTLSIETNGVAIPDSAVTSLSGDVCKVVGTGTGKTIIWNAGADWPENEVDNARARVTAWSVDAPPQVMVIDLSKGIAASWPDNPYPCYYYTSVDALPGGGLTNVIYKNTRLVMRKILADTFAMGEGTPVEVTLTNDFYAGVFQVTQGQWYNVMGSQPAYFKDASSRAFRPVEQVSYNDIRGSTAGAGWPTNDAVDADSFMGTLRNKTGLAGLDLPTEAQWEYACRANTTTCFNDGDANANTSGDNGNSNIWLDVLGRYQFNGGYLDGVTSPGSLCSPENGTAIVGSYIPNTWGLYDMHGNVWEWCLDWHAIPLEGGYDPKGPVSGSTRVKRGGSFSGGAKYSYSAFRGTVGTAPSSVNSSHGFRLFRTLP